MLIRRMPGDGALRADDPSFAGAEVDARSFRAGGGDSPVKGQSPEKFPVMDRS